jgi:hypothetical protein
LSEIKDSCKSSKIAKVIDQFMLGGWQRTPKE